MAANVQQQSYSWRYIGGTKAKCSGTCGLKFLQGQVRFTVDDMRGDGKDNRYFCLACFPPRLLQKVCKQNNGSLSSVRGFEDLEQSGKEQVLALEYNKAAVPGLYKLLFDGTEVAESEQGGSEIIHRLLADTIVNVAEARYLQEDDCVRGRIDDPVDGWVSLFRPSDAHYWVAKQRPSDDAHYWMAKLQEATPKKKTAPKREARKVVEKGKEPETAEEDDFGLDPIDFHSEDAVSEEIQDPCCAHARSSQDDNGVDVSRLVANIQSRESVAVEAAVCVVCQTPFSAAETFCRICGDDLRRTTKVAENAADAENAAEKVAAKAAAKKTARRRKSAPARPRKSVVEAATSKAALFRIGSRARCVNLQNRPEANGEYCVLKSFASDSGRWNIQMVRDQQLFSVKPENLEPVPKKRKTATASTIGSTQEPATLEATTAAATTIQAGVQSADVTSYRGNPNSLPQGWKAVAKKLTGDSKFPGRIYVRFHSLDGRHTNVTSFKRMIELYCQDNGLPFDSEYVKYHTAWRLSSHRGHALEQEEALPRHRHRARCPRLRESPQSAAAEEAVYPREIPMPPGLPDGWKVIEYAYKSGSNRSGKTYLRYHSLDGRHKHVRSVKELIQLHCAEAGVPWKPQYERYLGPPSASQSSSSRKCLREATTNTATSTNTTSATTSTRQVRKEGERKVEENSEGEGEDDTELELKAAGEREQRASYQEDIEKRMEDLEKRIADAEKRAEMAERARISAELKLQEKRRYVKKNNGDNNVIAEATTLLASAEEESVEENTPASNAPKKNDGEKNVTAKATALLASAEKTSGEEKAPASNAPVENKAVGQSDSSISVDRAVAISASEIPDGLPDGWKAIKRVYKSSSKRAGQAYVRFYSSDGRHNGVTTFKQMIKLYCEDHGLPFERELAKYQAGWSRGFELVAASRRAHEAKERRGDEEPAHELVDQEENEKPISSLSRSRKAVHLEEEDEDLDDEELFAALARLRRAREFQERCADEKPLLKDASQSPPPRSAGGVPSNFENNGGSGGYIGGGALAEFLDPARSMHMQFRSPLPVRGISTRCGSPSAAQQRIYAGELFGNQMPHRPSPYDNMRGVYRNGTHLADVPRDFRVGGSSVPSGSSSCHGQQSQERDAIFKAVGETGNLGVDELLKAATAAAKEALDKTKETLSDAETKPHAAKDKREFMEENERKSNVGNSSSSGIKRPGSTSIGSPPWKKGRMVMGEKRKRKRNAEMVTVMEKWRRSHDHGGMDQKRKAFREGDRVVALKPLDNWHPKVPVGAVGTITELCRADAETSPLLPFAKILFRGGIQGMLNYDEMRHVEGKETKKLDSTGESDNRDAKSSRKDRSKEVELAKSKTKKGGRREKKKLRKEQKKKENKIWKAQEKSEKKDAKEWNKVMMDYACAHPFCKYAVHADASVSDRFCCDRCERSLREGSPEPKHGKQCQRKVAHAGREGRDENE